MLQGIVDGSVLCDALGIAADGVILGTADDNALGLTMGHSVDHNVSEGEDVHLANDVDVSDDFNVGSNLSLFPSKIVPFCKKLAVKCDPTNEFYVKVFCFLSKEKRM